MHNIADIVKVPTAGLSDVYESQLIELGHDNSSKTSVLFPALLKLISWFKICN